MNEYVDQWQGLYRVDCFRWRDWTGLPLHLVLICLIFILGGFGSSNRARTSSYAVYSTACGRMVEQECEIFLRQFIILGRACG